MTPSMPFRNVASRAMLPLDDLDFPPPTRGPAPGPMPPPAGAPPPGPAAPAGAPPMPGMAQGALPPPVAPQQPPWSVRAQPDGSSVYYMLEPLSGKEIILGVNPPPRLPKALQPPKQTGAPGQQAAA